MPKSLSFFISRVFYLSLCVRIVLGILSLYVYITWDIPSLNHLRSYNPPTITRLYSSDHKLFAEYATEKRIFVPIQKVPRKLIDAFLVVEDKSFFKHAGVDYSGILRATIRNLQSCFSSRSTRMGGSTITQQVAKNFFLSNEKTFSRKIKEIILAFKIEKEYSKDKILELYLNEIYLGGGSYGIVSAAHHYFNKTLDELSNEEIAYLSILPKAPTTYDFRRNPKAALKRRNWALMRMEKANIINTLDSKKAMASSFSAAPPKKETVIHADYFSEMLRKEIYENYGKDVLYKGGLLIQTTLDSHLQKLARKSLLEGLVRYDRSFGWRGPLGHISLEDWQKKLQEQSPPKGMHPYIIAVVLATSSTEAWVGFQDGSKGTLPLKNIKWARRHVYGLNTLFPSVGAPVQKISDVLSIGDVICVSLETKAPFKPAYKLEQIPEVNGAIVVINPKNGHILAMEGGYSFEKSQFNRAVQAFRQPGSAFKPFVYLTALEKGYTPDSLISDEEIEIDLGDGKIWKPHNITKKSYGLVTLKSALERSMNLATLWLVQQIGIRSVEKTAQDFGILKRLPPEIVAVLGTVETTLLKLTNAYACLANQGYKVTPQWIQSIQDRRGNILYERKTQEKKSLVSEKSAHQIISILESSVKRGASRRARIPGYSIGGKTGTSNDYFDAWFIGFSPDLVVGIIVGFDKPKSLGKFQTGSSVAAPIFKDFMIAALKDTPVKSFPIPSSIKTAWVDQVMKTVDETDKKNDKSSFSKDLLENFDKIIPKSIFLEGQIS
ncbi:PBP1A family penicillin-binding protein [Alphaproteobacteria bacterium]|nr:PBP1A family penicillin-binding protein [Alphaproteobacteria bacterium]